MRKIIFIFLITLNFSSAQVSNNCTTTNAITKIDENGNIVCTSIIEDGSKIDILGDFPSSNFDNYSLNIAKSVKIGGTCYFLDDTFTMTGIGSPDKLSFYINNKKTGNSAIWKIGSTFNDPTFGTKNGFSIMEGYSVNQTKFFIQDGTGNIGIGTNTIPASYKLAVAGKIIAEELKVQLQTSWPDYVFTDEHKLPTLQEVEKHIKEKGYLKNFPSAKDVKENGIELGEITRIQQEKIEELTLYIIELNKKLEELENKMNNNLVTK